MRYPIIRGVLPPLEPICEYQIVTAAGIISCTFDDRKLAERRFKEINNPSWKLIKITKRIDEITPKVQPTLVAA